MHRIILTGLSLLLLGCAHKPAPEPTITEDFALWLDTNNDIHFHGRIYEASVQATMDLYANAAIKPQVLRITSGGGDLRAGLRFGNWIHSSGIGVYVSELCASACANYAFLGARNKYLDEQAVLIWHGGARQTNLLANFEASLNRQYQHSAHEASIRPNTATQTRPSKTCEWDEAIVRRLEKPKQQPYILSEVRSCIDKLITDESAFFKLIKVDPELPYYGQHGKYKVLYESKLHRGFDFSLQDLETMGVNNIFLMDGEWNPKNSKLHSEGKVYRITQKKIN